MKISCLTFVKLRLPLKQPLVTARATLSERETFIIALRDSDGRIGIGEAAPLSDFGGESAHAADGMLSYLARQSFLPDCEPTIEGIAVCRESMGLSCSTYPVTSFGVECALLSLVGQAKPAHPGRLIGLPAGWHDIKTHALISGNDVESVGKAIAQDFATVKIKIGVHSARQDIDMLHDLHERFLSAVWRADANGKWDVLTATYFLNETEDCQLDFVEDPVGMNQIAELTCLPPALRQKIAYDESAARAENPAEFFATHEPAVVILKPALVGSFRRLDEWRAAAKPFRTRLIVTSFLESSIGLCYDALCALAVDLRHDTHGLATAGLFSADTLDQPFLPVHGLLTSRDPRALADGLVSTLKAPLLTD